MLGKQNILVICGATSTGKTDLAIRVAKLLPVANILSVDSRQIYKGLDIVTGKDIPSDLPSTISIYGHNLYSPDVNANLADFVKYSQEIIKNSLAKKTPLIIVGGTGLYLNGVTGNYQDIFIPPNDLLRLELEKLSVEDLQNKLKSLDPSRFNTLNHSDQFNPRRLIRHIEISLSKESKKTPINQDLTQANFVWIGLQLDKTNLVDKIRSRVISRIKNGAIEEVKKLNNTYQDTSLPIFTSLGIKQINNFLSGSIDNETLIADWTSAETDYARRQVVWFQKQPGIFWYDMSIDREKLAIKMSKLFKTHA